MTDALLDPGPPRQRRSARRLLQAAALLCLFVFVALALVRTWPQARSALAQLSIAGIGASFVAVLLGQLASFLCWRAILTDCGAPLPVTSGLRVFFLGQLGKYLPGSVWSVVAQVELGRDYKVARRVSGAAVVIFMLLVLATGLLVGTASLWLLGHETLDRYWWTLAALPAAAVLLYPPVLNRLVGLALRLTRRPPMPSVLSLAGIAKAAAWTLLTWTMYGLHVWVLALDVGAGGRGLLWRSIGAFAAAWSVGFLVVFAPAGAGVREAVLILALRSTMSGGQATVVALASRLLFSVGDLTWGLGVLLARRRHPRNRDEPGVQAAGRAGDGRADR